MTDSKKERVKAICGDCGGTGVYCGFAELEGVGVVCLGCAGSGCTVITYEPFVARRERRGVRVVRRSRGSFIATGVGPIGTEVSYADFKRGKMPS